MKVIRWPELDTLESNLELINEFWYKTNKGPINIGLIFPISERLQLRDLKNRIEAKKKELSDVESEIYRISRKF